MILRKLQHDLETIYRLKPLPCIDHFLISTQEMKRLLPKDNIPAPKVLFSQEADDIFLAVHIGDETLARVESQELGTGGLQDFCSAVEEISHFLYLFFRASNESPVSLLDVEIQGDIDKFLLASLYFPDQRDLFANLFEHVTFHETSPPEREDRYRQANWLSSKFVKSLGAIFAKGVAKMDGLRHLRLFYRWNTCKRLSHMTHL